MQLYDCFRGPAENMTVLATTYSDVEENNPNHGTQMQKVRADTSLF